MDGFGRMAWAGWDLEDVVGGCDWEDGDWEDGYWADADWEDGRMGWEDGMGWGWENGVGGWCGRLGKGEWGMGG